MRKLTTIILLLCALVVGAQAAIDYTPLRTYMSGLGDEFRLGAVGDSWTCNAQYAGEVVGSWTDDEVGASGPYAYTLIWGDKTAMNGASWINRLGYRLGTHKVFAEAIGGAELGALGIPFTFKEDSTIAGWIDNLAANDPQVAFIYGGINDLLGYGGAPATRTYANLREQALQSTIMMLQQMPSNIPIIKPTLQPCGLDYFKFKVHSNPAAYANMTWTQIADTSYNAQMLINQVNTFITDSLRYFVKEAGYDSSRVYPYDHFEMLAEQVTWTAGADASTYPLDLSEVTSEGAMSQADSVKYAAIRFLRPEIESDSIHCNLMGLRQIGDSMAVNLFGIDLDAWEDPTPATLYVDKDKGHNWENRRYGFSRSYPAATLQGAITNAWPGDYIEVIGTGNQAMIDSEGNSPAEYEVCIDRPIAKITFADGAYYDGAYSSGDFTGVYFFDNDGFSGGDGAEILPTHLPLTSGSVPVCDMGGLVIDGLRVEGYHYPILLTNVSGITFKNLTLIGGGQNGGGFKVTNYDDTLTVNIDYCTFYIDSSSTGAGSDTYPRGRLNFEGLTSSASCLFNGTISNSRFIGNGRDGGYSMIQGHLDGMSFIGNTFTDPASYYYVIENKRYNTYPDSSMAPLKLISNTFECYDPDYLYAYRCGTASSDANADSVLILNNYMDFGGSTGVCQIYAGPANSKTWLARNVISEDATSTLRMASGSTRTLAQVISNGWAPNPATDLVESNWVGIVSAQSDSVMFGGLVSVTHGSTYNLSAFGITHGENHASIGATQYVESPVVSAGSIKNAPQYAVVDGPWNLLRLVNAGVLQRSDSLDSSTWYKISMGTNDADRAQYQLYIDAYNDWDKSSRDKIRWRAVK